MNKNVITKNKQLVEPVPPKRKEVVLPIRPKNPTPAALKKYNQKYDQYLAKCNKEDKKYSEELLKYFVKLTEYKKNKKLEIIEKISEIEKELLKIIDPKFVSIHDLELQYVHHNFSTNLKQAAMWLNLLEIK